MGYPTNEPAPTGVDIPTLSWGQAFPSAPINEDHATYDEYRGDSSLPMAPVFDAPAIPNREVPTAYDAALDENYIDLTPAPLSDSDDSEQGYIYDGVDRNKNEQYHDMLMIGIAILVLITGFLCPALWCGGCAMLCVRNKIARVLAWISVGLLCSLVVAFVVGLVISILILAWKAIDIVEWGKTLYDNV